ncbi:hypothetical protein KAFR_0D00260 [Kazachstania africana CBS 2517]|uniref:Receptor L-domain domain-containing protein n=1 Tax=Kazachstania africana (strain ATCC 22294 / BCRC 22015 / CBS 2517 / CECT 1963 / NBRC 1671 / NRRL Y-8276) TaxID=1071382 RepID=H2ATH3_KAZAF|nr:hypothetical protein KAFR_0D00260 [Kazachstania africana CBS 2517]CCF57673.1 hypothetical protein KAFR_0D00260 [Kazachstania africana CBS 2517]
MKLLHILFILGTTSASFFSFNKQNKNDVVPQHPLPHTVKIERNNSSFSVLGKREAKKFNEFCFKDNHIIDSSNDIYQLNLHCSKKIIGNVVVSAQFSENVIDLQDIERINGDLIIENNVHITRINANSLKFVTGNVLFNSLTSLITIDLPIIEDCNSIDWKVLPILNNANFNNKVMVHQNIIISDTSISNIEGFDKIKEISIFNINNNRFLETVKTNLKFVTTQFSVHANAKDIELDMPMLQEVQNATIRDTSYVSLPNLEVVHTSLEFIENDFSTLEVPSLKFVGGTLSIMENKNLKDLNFNNITEIEGGLMISHNKKLNVIDSFQNLKMIGGAIHFEGEFNDAKFNNLKLVKGSVFIKSNSNELDCNKWIVPLNGRSIIRGGKVKCISLKKQSLISVDEDGNVVENIEGGNDLDGHKKTNDTASLTLPLSLIISIAIVIVNALIL